MFWCVFGGVMSASQLRGCILRGLIECVPTSWYLWGVIVVVIFGGHIEDVILVVEIGVCFLGHDFVVVYCGV